MDKPKSIYEMKSLNHSREEIEKHQAYWCEFEAKEELAQENAKEYGMPKLTKNRNKVQNKVTLW